MPTGFHPHAHLHSQNREIAVELLRFLAVLQSTLPAFASIGIHKSNLLKTRVVVTTYNPHVRLLSPELLWLVGTTEVCSGPGADIVIESITLKIPLRALDHPKSEGRLRPANAFTSIERDLPLNLIRTATGIFFSKGGILVCHSSYIGKESNRLEEIEAGIK